MRQVQKPEEIAENAASVPLRSEENAHVESHHKGLCRFSVKNLTVFWL